ncbi:MAG: CRISPR-associated helicase/endonuclease Cas3 [Phycisphaerales bacterium]
MLDLYVAALGGRDPTRDAQRCALYEGCCDADYLERIVSCQAAVGLGKTTAVTRYLLGQAARAQPPLRRLFVVAPFTNIITQTARALRKALVLPGEDPHEVVAEHHHRVDFADQDHRTLATLWRAPVVVTTAVQFFETLGANQPADLRKFHEVPGSAIYIDEAHAAIPVHLWPQCWRWLRELADQWSCRIVLASGSLVRFWQEERVIAPTCVLPELTPEPLLRETQNTELARVSLGDARPADPERYSLTRSELVERLADATRTNGPVLAILNTVQSAAVIARDLAERLEGIKSDQHPHPRPLRDRQVLHLSTALTPRDRQAILEEIERRQGAAAADYILVATSIVEAGVDLDFQSAFRERASVAAFIQTSGRVNRHGLRTGAALHTFQLEHDDLLKAHPAFRESASVFDQFWPQLLAGHCPGDLATNAMSHELDRHGGIHEQLSAAEVAADYPRVAKLCRVIDSDTCVVVVDDDLRRRLELYEHVPFKNLQAGSVQLWAAKIDKLALPASPLFTDVYLWNDAYDRFLLGIMAGLLRTEAGGASGAFLG